MKEKLAIVIPYYNAQDFILTVVEKALIFSDTIIIVNDNSPQPLPIKELEKISQVVVIKTPENMGVGGATKFGFNYATSIDHIVAVVKLDADDQMDATYIPCLAKAVIVDGFAMAKGNRFRDFKALKNMPAVRRMGNLFLSFLSKISTGYWNCFDFNNGFLCIATENIKAFDFDKISNDYFFETSLISELYFQRGKIKEIGMPAIYGDEESNMKLFQMPFLFSVNLFKKYISRILKGYFMYDFNIGSIYIIFGWPLFLGGVIFGSYNWYHYASLEKFTPVGTIMISALLIIVGFQLLLQALQFDMQNNPNNDR